MKFYYILLLTTTTATTCCLAGPIGKYYENSLLENDSPGGKLFSGKHRRGENILSHPFSQMGRNNNFKYYGGSEYPPNTRMRRKILPFQLVPQPRPLEFEKSTDDIRPVIDPMEHQRRSPSPADLFSNEILSPVPSSLSSVRREPSVTTPDQLLNLLDSLTSDYDGPSRTRMRFGLF